MASGKGTIILLPHLGNWEMFNIYFRRKGVMTALYQPPRQDWLKPLMQVVRGKAGNELVATNVKGLAKLYRTLSEAGVVTILPDQVPQVGVYANFFNHAALTDRLVPRLIQKTGARVVVCIVYRNAGKFNVRFSEVDDALYEANMDTALGGLNRSIELAINDYLPQYQWEYKRFRERPAGEKKIYKFNGENRYHE